MEMDAQALIKKYEQSIEEIIQRYKDIDDSYYNVVDINDANAIEYSCMETVCFISPKSKECFKGEPFIGFNDVYRRLCCNVDFDEIAGFFK